MNNERRSYWPEVGSMLLVAAALALVLCTMAGCVSTRPHAAHVRPDGTRVGVSKQVVYFKGYQMAEAIHVAQDNAGITIIDTARHTMRVRAWGTTYITTVVGQ